MTRVQLICNVCGHEDSYSDPVTSQCSSCGSDFSTYPPEKKKTRIKCVELKGHNGLVIRTQGDTFVLNRKLAENMFGNVANCVSRDGQFMIRREGDTEWIVAHYDSATNPTLLDSKPVSVTGEKLEEGTRISVGTFSLEVIFTWE